MHQTTVTVYDPPGYGLTVLGAVIPFPPAPVLWALAVLDLVATAFLWKRPDLWWALSVCMLVSAYLMVVGIFSIGPVYAVLLIVQAYRLGIHVASRGGPAA